MLLENVIVALSCMATVFIVLIVLWGLIRSYTVVLKVFETADALKKRQG
jgi:Na+-transporting methylmalonyl-CoA/oxaloacetate decarboxylase gamma subunit